MTLYHVHVYREMRLFFPGIEASSPEHAAGIAKDRPTAEAEAIEDCHGENLSAWVGAAGDDYLLHSQCFDFEATRLRKAVPGLLAALAAVKIALTCHDHWADTMPGHLLCTIDRALGTGDERRLV